LLIERLPKLVEIGEEAQQELEASVSHWLQNPNVSIPLFSNEMRDAAVDLLLQVDQKVKVPGAVKALQKKVDYFFLPFEPDWKGVPYPPPKKYDFTFIDLFAGIGGFRLAFQAAGGKCVFSSEWDRFAKSTYEANFGEVPYGDIRNIPKNDVPDHDVLCAGFPCQPFSLAGVSKKNSLGRKHGFDDETQGTLFFDIKEIIRTKRPKAFMLENVKNLVSHDKGKTFEVIRHSLVEQLGYVLSWKVVDGSRWVPQHRERIFLVGYDPKQIDISREEIHIPEKPGNRYKYPELKSIIHPKIEGYTLGPGTWDTLERHKAHHAKKGNGFGYGLHRLPIEKGAVTRTISARYHKDGAEILIEQEKQRPRRLSVAEAMQLQGYNPDTFIFPVSQTQCYKQIGNSVVVPAIQACAKQIAKELHERGSNDAKGKN